MTYLLEYLNLLQKELCKIFAYFTGELQNMIYHFAWAVLRHQECHTLYTAPLQSTASALYCIMHCGESFVTYFCTGCNLCNIARVLVTKTTTTPHLTGGKTICLDSNI